VSEIWPYIAGIVPTILVATMFYFLIKSMIEGDRRERLAQSRFEAEQDRERRTAPSQPSESVVDRETSNTVVDSETSSRGTTPEPRSSGSSGSDS
jgi:hypothetical protein